MPISSASAQGPKVRNRTVKLHSLLRIQTVTFKNPNLQHSPLFYLSVLCIQTPNLKRRWKLLLDAPQGSRSLCLKKYHRTVNGRHSRGV
ncbi:hypothetical protein K7X08_021119 [Anisodus acutangulus]|uniref:Uncharacterized protein n=1 Tax=Anisodus acutangulus TaxID=402998 RepID=A0A9Q1M2F5_9SOLA|nr:hypothetical protein K7X08_021119 [Anisodus acutangulus]